MQISKTSFGNNIYATKAISMKAKKTDESIIKDFRDFMKTNHLLLNAKLTPRGKNNFYTELELSKATTYSTTPLTDSDGYAISSNGFSINDAILEMAKKYKGQQIYTNTGTLLEGKLPNFFA